MWSTLAAKASELRAEISHPKVFIAFLSSQRCSSKMTQTPTDVKDCADRGWLMQHCQIKPMLGESKQGETHQWQEICRFPSTRSHMRCKHTYRHSVENIFDTVKQYIQQSYTNPQKVTVFTLVCFIAKCFFSFMQI